MITSSYESVQSGRISIEAVAHAPIHHGGGSKGNRQILRKQSFILPDGAHARVPFLSGNSFRHLIRASAARYALEVMRVEPGSLSKGMVHLLFSGGALSGSGAAVKLSKIREVEQAFPLLSLLGYSASNHISGGRLTVDHWHIVCRENAWRLPDSLREHPHARLRVGELIDDEFGTRHEPTRSDPDCRKLLAHGDAATDDAALEAAAELAAAGQRPEKSRDSAQMIYNFEVVKAGSVWFGGLRYQALSPHEIAALKSGLAYACGGQQGESYLFARGAKSAVGYGAMALGFEGSIRELTPSAYVPDSSLATIAQGVSANALSDYASHLESRRDEILSALREVSR